MRIKRGNVCNVEYWIYYLCILKVRFLLEDYKGGSCVVFFFFVGDEVI